MNEHISMLSKRATALTKEPGVYLMKNQAGEIIYVGKAKNLKNRVSSYFRALDKHTPKVLAMVNAVETFEIIVTRSEFEALVLECSLIKQHNPKYNILLKDDKGYSYLRIDNGEFPRITSVKQTAEDGAQYIGPYMSGWVVNQMVDEVNKSFGLATCNRVFPRDFKKARPCLNYHMGQCMGVCRGNITSEEYREFVRRAVETLKGKSDEAKRLLTQQMEDAAEALDFERAARYRDRLRAIERFSERQHVVYTGTPDQDVLAFVSNESAVAAVILRFRSERLVDKIDFVFYNTDSIAEVRDELIARYYTDEEHSLPSLLLVDELPEDVVLISELLSQRLSKKVTIRVPQRGDNVKLMEMARLNAAELLSAQKSRTGREVVALDALKRVLGLPKTPSYIESYDISNIGNDTIVGAMVVFEDGRPKKSNYKRFKIKEQTGADDYAAMSEMIHRRFSRYLEQEEGSSFSILPDLLLIDGGKGHVAVVEATLASLSLSIPTFGMVKDDRHRTRAITSGGEEIAISALKQVFSLVTNIQDETHRFAIDYARSSHKKTAFALTLTKVKGIGEQRATALYRHFKTKQAILSATEEELANAPGMTKSAAKSLREAVEGGLIS